MVINGSIESAGTIELEAVGDITINGSIESDGTIELEAVGDITINGSIESDGTIGLEATGDMAINGPIESTGDISLATTGTGDITVADAIESNGGSIAITSGRDFELGIGITITGSGPIEVTVAGDMAINGPIESTGDISLTTTGTGDITVADAIESNGGSIAIISGGDFELGSVATITGSGPIGVTAVGDMAINGPIESTGTGTAGNISLTAAGIGGITVTDQIKSDDGNITLIVDDIAITSSGLIDAGATGTVKIENFSTGGTITLGGSGTGMSFTNFEYPLIKASVVELGSFAKTSSIDINSAITLDTTVTNLILRANNGSNDSITGLNTYTVPVPGLAIQATGDVTIGSLDSASLAVDTTGDITVTSIAGFTIAEIGGIAGLKTNPSSGIIDLTTSGWISQTTDGKITGQTLTIDSVGEVDLDNAANGVSILEVTDSDGFQFKNSGALGIIGISSTKAIVVEAGGALAISGAVSATGTGTDGNIRLTTTSGGNISQTTGVIITGQLLTIASAGAVDLGDAAHVVSTLSVTGSAGLQFKNGGALGITGISSTKAIAVEAGGAIAISGTISTTGTGTDGNISLTTTFDGISQTAGNIQGRTLTIDSDGAVDLSVTANVVSALNVTDSDGFQFKNSGALGIIGINSTKAIAVEAGGALAISGAVSATSSTGTDGDISLITTSGGISQTGTGTITGVNVTVQSALAVGLGLTNMVDTLTISGTGSVDFKNGQALSIGIGTAGITSNGFPVTVETAAGNITVNNAVNSSGGAVTITAAGDITTTASTGTITSINGTITLVSDAFNLGAAIDAGIPTGTGTVKIWTKTDNAPMSIDGSPGSGTRLSHISASILDIGNHTTAPITGNITISNITTPLSVGNVIFESGGNITVDTSVSLSKIAAGNISFEANGVVTINGSVSNTVSGYVSVSGSAITVAGGGISAASGDVTLTTASGDILVNGPISGDDITLVTAGTVTQTGMGSIITAATLTVTAGGVVTLNGATNSVGTLTVSAAGGDVDFLNGPNLTVAGISASNHAVTVTTTTGHLTVSGAVNSGGGAVTVTTATTGNITVNGAVNSGGGAVTVTTATTGNITVSGPINSGGGVIAITAAGTIAVNGVLTAGTGLVSLNSAGAIAQSTSGAITGNTLVLTAGGGAALDSAANSVGTLTVNGAGGNVVFKNGQALIIGIGGISAAGHAVTVTTTAGAITVNGAVLGAGISLGAAGPVIINSGITSGTSAPDISITAGGSITVNGPVTSGDASVPSSGPVLLTASGAVIQTAAGVITGMALTVTAADAVTLNSVPNGVGTLAVTVSGAGGDVSFLNGSALAIGGISAAGHVVTVTTATGALTVDGAVSGTAITLETQDPTAGAGTIGQNPSVAITGDTLALTATAAVTLDSATNSVGTLIVTVNGTGESVSFVNGPDLIVGGISAAGNAITVTALAGVITEDGPVLVAALTLDAAGDVVINGGIISSDTTTLKTAGTLSQTEAGIINAAVLKVESVGAVSLNGAENVIHALVVTGLSGVGPNGPVQLINAHGIPLQIGEAPAPSPGIEAPDQAILLIADDIEIIADINAGPTGTVQIWNKPPGIPIFLGNRPVTTPPTPGIELRPEELVCITASILEIGNRIDTPLVEVNANTTLAPARVKTVFLRALTINISTESDGSVYTLGVEDLALDTQGDIAGVLAGGADGVKNIAIISPGDISIRQIEGDLTIASIPGIGGTEITGLTAGVGKTISIAIDGGSAGGKLKEYLTPAPAPVPVPDPVPVPAAKLSAAVLKVYGTNNVQITLDHPENDVGTVAALLEGTGAFALVNNHNGVTLGAGEGWSIKNSDELVTITQLQGDILIAEPIVPGTGKMTIKGIGNVTVGAGFSGAAWNSTIEMTGGPSYDTATHLTVNGSIGSLTIDAHVALDSDELRLAGSMEIIGSGSSPGRFYVGRKANGDPRVMYVGIDWTTNPGGAFEYENSNVVFTGENSWNLRGEDTIKISGNTTWYDFTCEAPGKTIEFSNYSAGSPDGHYVLHRFFIRGGEGNHVTMTRITDNGLPPNDKPDLFDPAFAAERDKFWYFSTELDTNVDIDFVTIRYSWSKHRMPIPSPKSGRSILATPYYDTADPSNSYYNINWVEIFKFFYAFTEDSDGNGRVDRLRAQTAFELNGDFSNFQVEVEGFELDPRGPNNIPYALVTDSLDPDAGDSIYIYLKEHDYADGDAAPILKVLTDGPENTLRDLATGLNPITEGAPVTTDTVFPRITYTLMLPNSNKVFVQFSEQINDSLLQFSFTGLPVQAAVISPGFEYELTLPSEVGVADLAAGDRMFIVEGLRDLAVPADDASLADPDCPFPKYPLDWKYTNYRTSRTSALIPPNGPPVDSTDDAMPHRLTDILISLPPTGAQPPENESFFVWPVWAINPQEYIQSEQADIHAVRNFSGMEYLEEKDITLQVNMNAAFVPGGYKPELFFSAAVPDNVRIPHGNTGLWLPNFDSLGYNNDRNPAVNIYTFSNIVPIPYADAGRNSSPAAISNNVFNFNLSKSNYTSVSMLEFFFRLSGGADSESPQRRDLYIGRLANNSKPWYHRVEPFKLEIHNITRQRSGATVLNNVIKPSTGEKVYLDYKLTRNGPVTIQVFTLDGTLVKVLVRENKISGEYRTSWDGKNNGGREVARGMYFIRVVAPDIDEIRKVMVVK
ncbi:hypothetical protein [Treponema primitia]|uniref:hypothetical protein n=1 Tax=Treponema primitia TaxID=88058 RepID=UPI0002555515|nr:hypothetical protein [Treponema primitia]